MPLSLTGIKILAFFVVMLCGLLGPSCPVIFAYFAQGAKNQRRIQKVIKVMTCLAIGIVVSTALIHMLHEGGDLIRESGKLAKAPSEEEKEPKIKYIVINNCTGNVSNNFTTPAPEEEGDDDDEDFYPFGMVFALIGVGIVYVFSTELNWYGMRKLKELQNIACDEEEEQRQGAIIKLYILETGIAVHSVIIGVTLGLTDSYSTASTLFAVLCIHQFFEGLAIGSLCIQAHVTTKQALGFIGTFAITTPLGIVIGLGVSGDADKLTQGILSCMSAGLLLEMALTEMLGSVFGAHQHHAHGPLPLAEIADHLHHSHHGHSHSHHNCAHSHSKTSLAKAGDDNDNNQHQQQQHSPSAASNNNDATVADNINYGSFGNDNHTSNNNSNSNTDNNNNNNNNNMDENDNDDSQSVSSRKSLIIGRGSYKKACAEHPTATEDSQTNLLLENKNLRASIALSDYVDDHEDDESIGFRMICYFALFVGMAIQSILGIWA